MKKTEKTLTILLILALSLGILAGCSGNNSGGSSESDIADAPQTEAPDTSSDLLDTADGVRTFVLGFDATFPPYGYQDEQGQYVGFDIDLAAEVCERLGWELVLQPIDWDAKDMEINSGTIDCIWNGFTINGREEQYTWTVPYVDNSQVFVVNSDSGIKTLDDLAGKVVVVQADSSAQAALEDEDNTALLSSFADLQKVAEYNTAVMNLESGAADAVAMDIGVAEYQINQRGDSLMILDEHLATEQYGVGFKLGNTALRDIVQEVLLAMADDGTFIEISDKWGLTDYVILGK